jgi:hypothetical protein
MSLTGDYFPSNPSEKLAYDALWALAKPQDGTISGRSAVEFLQLSGVDNSVLRTIWTLSCAGAPAMNINQFYTALRYISMVQKRGPTSEVSREQLLLTNSYDFGPPKFNVPTAAPSRNSTFPPFPAVATGPVAPGTLIYPLYVAFSIS